MSSKLVWGARLVRQNARRFTTSEKRLISKEEVEKIKKKQEEFQNQSYQGQPIHMIAGFSSDKSEGPPLPCSEPVPPCCPAAEEPPPCPPPPPPCGPPCPPPTCVTVPDPNNPCNYVPPENPDPSEPDMRRIKRKQCQFQQDDDLPIHLKGGKRAVYYFQAVTILGAIVMIQTIYGIYKMF